MPKKRNIQEYKDAIKFTEYASISNSGTVARYVYIIPSTGMMYEVDPNDDTITGQRCALDITWDRIPVDLTN